MKNHKLSLPPSLGNGPRTVVPGPEMPKDRFDNLAKKLAPKRSPAGMKRLIDR